MKKRKFFKRVLSLVLTFSLILGQIPLVALASWTDLDIATVNSDTSILSKGYIWNGIEHYVYLANDTNGTSRIFGDIPFAIGSDSYTQVRTIKGYYTLPKNYTEIAVAHYSTAFEDDALALFLLDVDGNLDTFTDVNTNDWDDYTLDGYNPTQTKTIATEVRKISEQYYLTNSGDLYQLEPHEYRANKLAENIDYFSTVNDNILQLKTNTGVTYYCKVTPYRVVDNYGNYVSAIECNSDWISYSSIPNGKRIRVNSAKNNVVTSKGFDFNRAGFQTTPESSITLFRDIAESEPNTYDIFENNVRVVFNADYLDITTTDGSDISINKDGVSTDFGYIKFLALPYGNFFDILITEEMEEKFKISSKEDKKNTVFETFEKKYSTDMCNFTFARMSDDLDFSDVNFDTRTDPDYSVINFSFFSLENPDKIITVKVDMSNQTYDAWDNEDNHIAQGVDYFTVEYTGRTQTKGEMVINERKSTFNWTQFISDIESTFGYYNELGLKSNIVEDVYATSYFAKHPAFTPERVTWSTSPVIPLDVYRGITIYGVYVSDILGDYISVNTFSIGNCVLFCNTQEIDYDFIINDDTQIDYFSGRLISNSTNSYSLNAVGELSKIEVVLDDYSNCYEDNVIATGVVKFNLDGYYLKANGDLYDINGNLINTEVQNIGDNTYKKDGIWYYLNTNEEIKTDRAGLVNIKALRYNLTETACTYVFDYDTDAITSLIAPNGDELNPYDEYTIYENGIHVFTATNKYGDTFNKCVIVSSLIDQTTIGANNIEVLNGVITFHNMPDAKYSLNETDWTAVSGEGVSYTAPIYIKPSTDSPTYVLTLNDEGKLKITAKNIKGINLEQFCGMGYIKNGHLYDIYGNDMLYGESDIVTATVTQRVDDVRDWSGNPHKEILTNYFAVKTNNNEYVSSYMLERSDADSTRYSNYPMFYKVFKSDKLRYENEEINPIKAFFYGVYTYIVGDTGTLVRAADNSDLTYGGDYGGATYISWKEEWLADDVISWDNNGVITTESGNTFDLTYNTELDTPVTNLKFYEVSGMGYSELTGITIKAFRPTSDGYVVLGTDNRIYVYSTECNGLLYNAFLGNDYDIDYSLSTTNWTKNPVELELNYSDGSNIPFEDLKIENINNSIGWKTAKLAPVYSEDLVLLDNIKVINNNTSITFYEYRYGSMSDNNIGFYLKNNETNAIYDTARKVCLDTNTIAEAGETLYIGWAGSKICSVEMTVPAGTYSLVLSDHYHNANFTVRDDRHCFKVNEDWISFYDCMSVDNMFESDYINDMGYAPEKSVIDNKTIFSLKRNGTYSIAMNKLNSDGSVDTQVSRRLITVTNIDIVKPVIHNLLTNVDNSVSFEFEDVAGTGEHVLSAISGVDKIYYSTNGTDYNELIKPLKYSKTGGDDTTVEYVNTSEVFVKAKDRAGNYSDVYKVPVGLPISYEFIYSNHSTDTVFWADTDTTHTDVKYSYSYEQGGSLSNGYTITSIIDETVNAKAEKTLIFNVSSNEDIEVKVVHIYAPNISEPNEANEITITVGEIINATFKEMKIKLDDAEYVSYNTESVNLGTLPEGNHTIKAYVVAEKNGTPIDGDIATKILTIVDKDIDIHPTVVYHNGSSDLDFYANDDSTYDKGYSYSYDIDSNNDIGHSVTVTEDTVVTMNATKPGYKNTSEDKNITVIKTDAPSISDLVNNKNVTVTSGNIVNANLSNIMIDIDNNGYVPYYMEQANLELLDVGTHTIKAYQTVTATIDGDVVEITSDITEKTVKVKAAIEIHDSKTYENHKTTVDFYGNDDNNNDKVGYSYSYTLDETTTNGHSVALTEDGTVKLNVTNDEYLPTSKDVNVKVIDVENPTISDLANNLNVTVSIGTIKNTDFEKLYIKIDDGEYNSYFIDSVELTLSNGEHTIKAYYTTKTTIDGDVVEIISDVVEKDVLVLKYITLHPSIEYSNKSTKLDFYANDDTSNTNFTYKYGVGVLNNGHTITVTEDANVTMHAEKYGYIPKEENIQLSVISTDAPTISQIENTKVKVTAGTHNYNLKKVSVSIDGSDYTDYTNDTVELTLPVGIHNIKAKQTVTATIYGEVIDIESDLSESNITVKGNLDLEDTVTYSKGRTDVTFRDKFDTGYTYTYSYKLGDNEYVNGYSFFVNEDTAAKLKGTGALVFDAVIDADIKVVDTDKPDITADSTVKVDLGTYKNSTFDKLYVSVNNADYKEYSGGTEIILEDGDYNIKAYQTVKAPDNTIITSEIAQKDITIHNAPDFYNLTVIDHFGADETERLNTNLLANTEYLITALGKDGWRVTSESQFIGILNHDTILHFYYEQEELDNPTTQYYTVKVVDVFNEPITRLEYKAELGNLYKFDALQEDGWTVQGSASYSGEISEDITITFSYLADTTVHYDKTDKVKLTVKDIFTDANNIKHTEIRYDIEVTKGYYCSVASVDRNGWSVVGTDLYTQAINEDTELIFNYNLKKFSFTIIDNFGDNAVERSSEELYYGTDFIATSLALDDWNAIGEIVITGTVLGDTTVNFYYEPNDVTIDTGKTTYALTVTDHFGENSKLRIGRFVVEGEYYKYEALSSNDWKAVGTTSYSGVVNGNVEIDFYYESITPPTTKLYRELIVVDHFGDNEETRFKVTKEKGYYYNVGALDRDTWKPIGVTNYSGTLGINTTLHFYYQTTLPTYYNLTVIDNFNGDKQTRCVETLLEGTDYIVSSLGLDDWNVIGADNYRGTLTEDTTVTFNYEADTPVVSDNSDYLNLTIRDIFTESNPADTVKETRINRKVKSGYYYSYSPLVRENWTPVLPPSSGKRSGTVTEDTTVDFYYEKLGATVIDTSHTLKVIDHFGEDEEVRFYETKPEGYYYNVGSVDRDGWLANSTETKKGTLTDNTTLHFYYTKIQPAIYTLTVIDHFGDEAETRLSNNYTEGYSYSIAPITKDGWNALTETKEGILTEDTVLDFYYEEEPNYYTLTIVDWLGDYSDIRCVETLLEGTEYIVNAKAYDNYNVVGQDTYTGIMDSDKVVNFYYESDTPSYSDNSEYDNIVRVYDNFGDTEELRCERRFKNGASYSFKPIERTGWVAETEELTGTVTGNTRLDFFYTQDNTSVSNKVKLTIYDHFDNAVEIRYSQTEDIGYYYNVCAIDRDGWLAKEPSNIKGTLTEDTNIHFYYDRIEPNAIYYTLTIIDNFDLPDLRAQVMLLEGTEYTVSALGLDSWNVVGADIVTGVMDEDKTINFYYEKDTPSYSDNDNYYELKVQDNWHYAGGNTEYETRVVRLVKDGYDYSYTPIERTGWHSEDGAKTGTVTENTLISFNYYEDIDFTSTKVTLKVQDHFGDSTEVRYSVSVPLGYYYNVGAVDRDGWLAQGEDFKAGTISANTVLDFYYTKIAKEPKYYDLTIYDVLDNNIIERTKVSLLEGTNFLATSKTFDGYHLISDDIVTGVMNADKDVYFYYEKTTEDLSDVLYTIKVVDIVDNMKFTRVDKKVPNYYNYNYSALNIPNKKPTGQTSYSGTVNNADVYIEFNYEDDADNADIKYELTVVDHFGDSIETRYSEYVDEGYYYNVGAIERMGYVAINPEIQEGTVTDDMTLHFYYEEIESPDEPEEPEEPEEPDTPDEPEEPEEPEEPDTDPDEPDDPYKPDEPDIIIEPDDPVIPVPRTGDTFNLGLYLHLLVLSGAMLIVTLLKKRNK